VVREMETGPISWEPRRVADWLVKMGTEKKSIMVGCLYYILHSSGLGMTLIKCIKRNHLLGTTV